MSSSHTLRLHHGIPTTHPALSASHLSSHLLTTQIHSLYADVLYSSFDICKGEQSLDSHVAVHRECLHASKVCGANLEAHWYSLLLPLIEFSTGCLIQVHLCMHACTLQVHYECDTHIGNRLPAHMPKLIHTVNAQVLNDNIEHLCT